jgi:DNA-binding transcriptional MerR regulator
MYTIGQMAKRYRLSRSTLLYYDTIGLLSAMERTPSNYRVYSEADCQRLERICGYREAGLPLSSIRELLFGAKSRTVFLLEARIHELSGKIGKLREQQKGIVRLLLDYQVQERGAVVGNQAWQEIFSTAGFNDFDQWKWHREFEMTSSEQHRLFLESAGAPADKVAKIQQWARSDYREKA